MGFEDSLPEIMPRVHGLDEVLIKKIREITKNSEGKEQLREKYERIEIHRIRPIFLTGQPCEMSYHWESPNKLKKIMKVILVPHSCYEGDKREYSVAYKAITLEGEEAIFYEDELFNNGTTFQQIINDCGSEKIMKRVPLENRLEI